MNSFIFTSGDINGIGPEISIKTFNEIFKQEQKNEIVFICPEEVFLRAISLVKPAFKYKIFHSTAGLKSNPEYVSVLSPRSSFISLDPGRPTKDSGMVSYDSIMTSLELSGTLKAVVTAPISKHALRLCGLDYPGHTEMLASYFNVKNYLMLFYSDMMICALATIHEPIKKVSSCLSIEGIRESLSILKSSLKTDFGIENPGIAVLGLNPHSGEQGRIGSEETEIIAPGIKAAGDPMIEGPFVADAFFGEKLYQKFTAVLGMYHDQVLIPFKMLSFSRGVNFTAGLPIVRTSPDHGTAYDIAWQGKASCQSMLESYYLAEKILQKRARNV